ncbi:MAG: hypothetical protein ABL871_09115 [Terricaulis sp.]
MADVPPSKDHFWVSLLLASIGVAVAGVGLGLISMAPMGVNDWFGLGPIFLVPGVICLLVGAVIIVAIIRR